MIGLIFGEMLIMILLSNDFSDREKVFMIKNLVSVEKHIEDNRRLDHLSTLI